MKKMKVAFILLVTAVIVSGLLFSLYVNSKISSIKRLQSSIAELQENSRINVKEETGAIKNLKVLFPDEGNNTESVEKAYRIAKSHGIKNLVFEQRSRELIELSSGKILKTMPASGKKQKVIYVYPIKISFNSGYRNMAEFIREIQNQDRMVTVENLTAKRDTEHLSVEMVVSIYSTEER